MWFAFCAAQASRPALRSLRIAIFCTRLDNRCRYSGLAIISSSAANPNFATAARGARRPRQPHRPPHLANVSFWTQVHPAKDANRVRTGSDPGRGLLDFHWRAAEAEKRALVERFEKPSGVSDEERLNATCKCRSTGDERPSEGSQYGLYSRR
jgi:hypothetical protein